MSERVAPMVRVAVAPHAMGDVFRTLTFNWDAQRGMFQLWRSSCKIGDIQ